MHKAGPTEFLTDILSSGSGIGLYTARQLSKDGWNISIADLNDTTGKAAADEVGGIFTQVDVTSYTSQANAFQRTWEKWGRIDFGQYIGLLQWNLRSYLGPITNILLTI